MSDEIRVFDATIPDHHLGHVPEVLGHPDEVLENPRLTTQEKRAVLASWASDANAVPHLPALRQLPDGAIVPLDDILRALKALDGVEKASRPQPRGLTLLWQKPFGRRALGLRQRPRFQRRSVDDDDPPPCPVSTAIRPRDGGGAAFARVEPILA